MATTETETTSRELLGALEVRKALHVGINKSYKIIDELNAELKAKHFLVIPHKVPAEYLYKRYGLGVKF